MREGVPFLTPMLATMAVFFVGPLLVLGAASVTGPDGQLTLDNFRLFVGDPFSVDVLLRTIALGLKAVVGVTLLGVPIALLYWHGGSRLRTLILFAALLPMLTSNVVRTFAWIVILGRNGPISDALVGLGLSSRPVSLLFSETGVLLALWQIELPLLVLPLIAVLSRAPRNLVDAAETLGAGRWRVLLTVLLPMVTPAMLGGWVLVFASATTSYVTHTAIGGAQLIYLPQFIYREIGVLYQWPLAAAVAFLLLVSTGAVILMLSALSRHRRLAVYG